MRKIILPIILIIVSISIFFYYTDPNYKSIKEMEKEEAQYDEALNKSKELQVTRDKLLSKFNTFGQENLGRIEKLLPDNVDNVRLILDLDNIANKYGMEIRDVSISRENKDGETIIEAKSGKFNTIVLGFTVSSSYDNFIKFIKDLENSLRIVDVYEVSFKASESDFNEYRLGVKTYWVE